MCTVLNYIRPFEGNHKADVAPGEKEFDTPVSKGKLVTSDQCLPILPIPQLLATTMLLSGS